MVFWKKLSLSYYCKGNYYMTKESSLYLSKRNFSLLCFTTKGKIVSEHYIFFKFIYLPEREHKQGEQQTEGESGSPLSREPNAGLDPRTLGS